MDKIKKALTDAQTIVNEVELQAEYKPIAFKEVLRSLLGDSKSSSVSHSSVQPAPRMMDEHETFTEFFTGLNCETKADEITAMAYFHGQRNESDRRLTVKDIQGYYQLIRPKEGNINRDAKTAVINAWLKSTEKKDGSSSWEIIPLGKKRIHEIMKNENGTA